MKIEDGLIQINQAFETLHREFDRLDREMAALDAKEAADSRAITARFDEKRDQQTAMKENVLKFFRIAQENSSRQINDRSAPRTPNLERLNDLVMAIDERNRNDPSAAEVISLAGGYVAWTDQEIRRINEAEGKEQAAFRDRTSAARAALKREKSNVLARCENYLRGGEVAELAAQFRRVSESFGITAGDLEAWNGTGKRKQKMLFGYQQYPVDVPKRLASTLKGALGVHFDEETRQANCPVGFMLDRPAVIHAECTPLNEQHIRQAVQGLIINFTRSFPVSEYRVTLLDSVHYSGDLAGRLIPLARVRNGMMDPVPHNENEMRQAVSLLTAYYKQVEDRIGNGSVFEYNACHGAGERIPLRTVVIMREDTGAAAQADAGLAYIVNNARRFGLNILRITRAKEGSKGREREKYAAVSDPDAFSVISDDRGNFYILHNREWLPFKWLEAPERIPDAYVRRMEGLTAPVQRSNRYFDRFPAHMPEKSAGARRPIELPFATDGDGGVISCSFEGDCFAAYIMGAAGSGKSTLLHTLISGLMMNYHPDEVELWLLDFKMLEFKRYAENCPPHVKYVLLEKSENLIFDIIDRLTEEMDRRQVLFSRKENGWKKLEEVPADRNIPAIFLIIDEFAQMSQIIKETKGEGVGRDYTLKLENLLTKGRALGIRFIFSSQTYTTGVSGLTDTACKQIQLRFALKNTADEIRETLGLPAREISDELAHEISTLPKYETIFKWRDGDAVHVARFRNMYAEDRDLENVSAMLRRQFHPVSGGRTDNATYIDKKPVLIDGTVPKTMQSQKRYYREYEASPDNAPDDGEALIYAGVPCSFNLARPFELVHATAENILLAGGGRDGRISVMLSVVSSYRRTRNPVTVWAHTRSSAYRKYRSTVLNPLNPLTDPGEICGQIREIRQGILRKTVCPGLVCVLGYEAIAADMEILGEGGGMDGEAAGGSPEDRFPTMDDILNMSDPEEQQRMIEEYNRRIQQPEEPAVRAPRPAIYDARSDLDWIIRRAPAYGLHFLFCFDNPGDFIDTRLPENVFKHKILFPVSRDDSLSILHNRKANELENGTCIYSNGVETFTMRPHIHRGVPCGAWTVDENGAVVQRE